MESVRLVDDAGRWRVKPWGRTRLILQVGQFLRGEAIAVTPGGYSSVHYHRYAANVFRCVEGVLAVAEFTRPPVYSRVHILEPGETYVARAGVVHCFAAREPVVAEEFYWPDNGAEVLAPDDIVRLTGNGASVEAFATFEALFAIAAQTPVRE